MIGVGVKKDTSFGYVLKHHIKRLPFNCAKNWNMLNGAIGHEKMELRQTQPTEINSEYDAQVKFDSKIP